MIKTDVTIAKEVHDVRIKAHYFSIKLILSSYKFPKRKRYETSAWVVISELIKRRRAKDDLFPSWKKLLTTGRRLPVQ